jgi:DNA end-binding protein Ku
VARVARFPHRFRASIIRHKIDIAAPGGGPILARSQLLPVAVWKGHISFGRVSFPVRLFAAGRAEAVNSHMLHAKDLARVKEVWYCAEEDKPINRSEIVKGHETSKDKYVAVEDDELEAIAPSTATSIDVVQFVKESEVDPIFFEHSYCVAPDDEQTKPYGLFATALKETASSAIAKFSMDNREHVALIRSSDGGLVLHTLFYPRELQDENRESAPAKAVYRKELDLAASLIH